MINYATWTASINNQILSSAPAWRGIYMAAERTAMYIVGSKSDLFCGNFAIWTVIVLERVLL